MSNNQNNQTVSKYQQTQTIQLSTVNYIGGTNRYRLSFPSPISFKKEQNPKISIFQYALYNSTFNISSSLGNNTYSIIWTNGTVYNFVIPDGYYSFTTLNQNIQYNMASNYLYLQSTSNSTQVLYFISVSTNSVQYASQISISYVPSAMFTGYQIPSGASWTLPTSNKYPQIVLCSGLMTLFGLTSPYTSTFPTSQTIQLKNGVPQNLAYLSNTYPVLSPTFCYILSCNFVNSPFQNIPSACFQIPLSASYGNLISNVLPSNQGITISEGKYSYIEIGIYDQYYNPIVPVDPEIVLTLILQYDTD